MNDELNVFSKADNQINNNIEGGFGMTMENPAMPVETPVVPMDIPAMPVETPVVPMDIPAMPVETPVVPMETVVPQNTGLEQTIINQADLTSGFNNISEPVVMENNQMNNIQPVTSVPLDPNFTTVPTNNVANMIENPNYDISSKFKSNEDIINSVSVNHVEEEVEEESNKGALIKIFLIGVILIAFVIVLPVIA